MFGAIRGRGNTCFGNSFALGLDADFDLHADLGAARVGFWLGGHGDLP